MKIDLRVFHFDYYKNIGKGDIEDIDIYGLFRITCGNKQYGYFEENKGEDEYLRGFEYSIPVWLNLYLEMLLNIKEKKYCAIRDIERMGIWIEFKMIGDQVINISIIEENSQTNYPNIVYEPLTSAVISEWSDEKTNIKELTSELQKAIVDYFKQLDLINPILKETPLNIIIRNLSDKAKQKYGDCSVRP